MRKEWRRPRPQVRGERRAGGGTDGQRVRWSTATEESSCSNEKAGTNEGECSTVGRRSRGKIRNVQTLFINSQITKLLRRQKKERILKLCKIPRYLKVVTIQMKYSYRYMCIKVSFYHLELGCRCLCHTTCVKMNHNRHNVHKVFRRKKGNVRAISRRDAELHMFEFAALLGKPSQRWLSQAKKKDPWLQLRYIFSH